METPSTIQQDPSDVLLEFVETLATIKVSPDKLKRNSSTMTDENGLVINY